MPLVDRGIGGEKVEVSLAFGILNFAAFCPGYDDGKRMVVVRTISLIHVDIILGFHLRPPRL
jgi:hypothetical protein